MMFRYPYAIRHYLSTQGWIYAAAKAAEFATKQVDRIEIEWYLNYCRRLPYGRQVD